MYIIAGLMSLIRSYLFRYAAYDTLLFCAVNVHLYVCFLPEDDYVTFGYLQSQICLSVCNSALRTHGG